jgi:hypothetical protein
MAYTPGPKELALRAQREERVAANAKKPTVAELREKVSKVKPVGKPKKKARKR